MDSGVLGLIITVLLCLAILVFGGGFIISKIHDKIEDKKMKKNNEKMQREYDRQLQKFKANALVCKWAQQAADFIKQDITPNTYKRKMYDVCCYEDKVAFVNYATKRAVFAYCFAKFNLEDLNYNKTVNGVCIDERFYLAQALAEKACEILEQYGIHTNISFEEWERRRYVDEDDYDNNDEGPTFVTIVYEAKKGKNKW